MKPDFLEYLSAKVMLADGAMGTYLFTKGAEIGLEVERLNLVDPDMIYAVHEEYIRAGSQVIETNTFGANRLKLGLSGLADQVGEINRAGARLAVRAAGDKVYVAGSVGPSGVKFPLDNSETSAGEVEEVFREQISALVDGGVDVVQIETFGYLDELLIALKAAKSVCDLPLIAQMVYPAGGRTQDSLDALACGRRLMEAGADVVGTNCGRGIQPLLMAVEKLAALHDETIISAFPNAGFPEIVGHRMIYPADPAYMARMLKEMIRLGVRLVGGCCGTTPTHIQEFRQHLNIRRLPPISVGTGGQRDDAGASVSEEQRRPGKLLDGLARDRLPVIVELDPPVHLDTDAVLEGARQLGKAGVDAISVAENPLAILRGDNLTLAYRIRERFGIPAILHLTCRDRNVLGLQNQIMSAHHLGIESILAISGDPATSSDQPGASGVFDVQSFGLVRMIDQFNRGRNLAGRDMKKSTDFSIGVAFSFRPSRPETQIGRLERKVGMGAGFVMTQPFFDAAEVEQMMAAVEYLKVPIFPGIFPLISARNADFLHNELPGITIPAWIRERLWQFEQVEDQRKAAMDITRGLIEQLAPMVDGLYLISPLNKWEITAELTREIRAAGYPRSRRLDAP